jgi:hypothetical protein
VTPEEWLRDNLGIEINPDVAGGYREWGELPPLAPPPPPPPPGPKPKPPTGPLPEEFSHEWMALRFSAEHHADWRFVELWGKWLQWTKARWRIENTLRTFELARRVCRVASASCVNPKVAREVARASAVAGVERLARADRRHARTFDQWNEDDWVFNQSPRKD